MLLYSHSRKDNNEIFYIGIGDHARPYSRSGRPSLWIEIADSVGYDVTILLKDISKEDASYWERRLISTFKKKSEGGILVNKSSEVHDQWAQSKQDNHKILNQ